MSPDFSSRESELVFVHVFDLQICFVGVYPIYIYIFIYICFFFLFFFLFELLNRPNPEQEAEVISEMDTIRPHN